MQVSGVQIIAKIKLNFPTYFSALKKPLFQGLLKNIYNGYYLLLSLIRAFLPVSSLK